MNKKQKIIVSIVGITIVLLALLGITYAYYLTRIQGNTNTNSISVTTAKLELVYGDNSAEIIRGTGTLMPDSNNAIGTKTFTVTNNGNDSSYVVVIDNVNITKASDGSETDFLSNDFRYTLSCVVKDKSGNVLSGETCNEQNDLTIFPIKGGILVGNDIPENKVHEYTFTLWYIDTGVDQSDDMGKSLQARINITDVNQMENPFKTGVTATDNASLAYNIIKNAKENKNGTEFVATPKSQVAESISIYESNDYELAVDFPGWNGVTYGDTKEAADNGENEVSGNNDLKICTSVIGKYISDAYYRYNYGDSYGKVGKCSEDGKPYLNYKVEKSLSITQDNYGTSYYFRGDVEDNYVTFNNMCWRIVRINGDGSIKLTLESQNVCSESMKSNISIGYADWGYKEENGKYIGDYKNSTSGMKNLLNTWFDTNFKSEGNLTNAGSKLKDEEWCLGNITNTYNYNYNGPYGLLGTTALENYSSGTRFYYETGRNLYGRGTAPNATLKCNGEIDISKIGTLTADEVVFAGGTARSSNYNYYLLKDSGDWWTLSRSYFDGTLDYAFFMFYEGDLRDDNYGVYNPHSVRPAVSLNTGVKITEGVGTKKNPYIINEG